MLGDPRAFDEAMMRQALVEAEAAGAADDVPIGAVIVCEGEIVGRGRNQRELLQDPTAHAEMIALTAAADALKCWQLVGCTLYVTLEPCVMCAGALVNARVDRVVFGADDPKAGGCGSVYNIVEDKRLNHRLVVTAGVLAEPCAELLRSFFAGKRQQAEK